jgi:hypothetical protein
MQEATGSDLKFIFDYVRQRRGMAGVRSMLKELNTPTVLISGVGEIQRSETYSEDVYKKVIEAAARTLGGDLRTRLNQIGYALGDRAKMTKFVARFTSSKQMVKLIEDGILFEIPYVKSSVNEVSKHIVIMRIKARKGGENFLDVSDGYLTAILDQSNKSLVLSEKKADESEISYKFVIGEKPQ